ncbi:MAG TPA: hypothetical protein VMW63_07530 [Methanoregulaceae archaeon]|nr:hypothetical protein [Methanoregulaceae archaeon]
MSLNDRWIGSELSVVERELACNEKYANIGFVQYDTKDGKYFYLHPSPFLKTCKKEIYHTESSPPPEHQFVEVDILDEKTLVFDKYADNWVKLKEINNWKLFDPAPLVQRRKLLDFREIIEYFTYPFKGEAEEVNEIAGCSSLFVFSSPPIRENMGGIKSAIYGKLYQWDLFRKPLGIIPPEFRKVKSEYYYYISKIERDFTKSKGEMNLAILKPEKTISDIPIVIGNVSKKDISRDYLDVLKIESNIITAHMLDSLLLVPKPNKTVEDMMYQAIYDLREECYSAGQRPYIQNIGDAIPKLASAYARLKSSHEIKSEDVRYVIDLWFSMRRKAEKLQSYPMKVSHMYELTTEGRQVYFKCYDTFGADSKISINEALKATMLDPIEFKLQLDSLIEKGYCIQTGNYIRLLEPYKKTTNS